MPARTLHIRAGGGESDSSRGERGPLNHLLSPHASPQVTAALWGGFVGLLAFVLYLCTPGGDDDDGPAEAGAGAPRGAAARPAKRAAKRD